MPSCWFIFWLNGKNVVNDVIYNVDSAVVLHLSKIEPRLEKCQEGLRPLRLKSVYLCEMNTRFCIDNCDIYCGTYNPKRKLVSPVTLLVQ